jgi:hypothetical protein
VLDRPPACPETCRLRKLGNAQMTGRRNCDPKYALRGERFRRVLREVGLTDLRVAARFLGLSLRQTQRISRGSYAASTAASKLLLLMFHTKTAASEF